MRRHILEVRALLDGWGPDSNIRIAELYTFTLAGGEVLRYSGFQCGLLAPEPNTLIPLFEFPLGPGFKHTGIKEQIGTAVDQLEIEVHAGPDDELALGANITWQKALWGGIFDGATCALWRAYIEPPLTVTGTITRFFGDVADVEFGRTKPVIKVNSLLHRLTNQMPRRLYQSACNHVYGGAMCGVDRVAGLNALAASNGLAAETITCLGGSDQNQILTSFTPATADDFDNGTIKGLTGGNANLYRTISKIDSGIIYMLHPWIFPVEAGSDTFQLLSGCAHTEVACERRANFARYGGFNRIPPPETAI